jgi:hypothetical protein
VFFTFSVALGALHCGSTATSSGVDSGVDGAKSKTDAPTKTDGRSTTDAPTKTDGRSTTDAPTKTDGPSPTDACVSSVPSVHYATAAACSSTRGPGDINSDAAAPPDSGTCTNDSQCTAGLNGRCMQSDCGGCTPEFACSYDQCTSDTDCSADEACVCGIAQGTGRTANICAKSACRVDSDCGTGGYCSPSLANQSCSIAGYVGNFCHTPEDQCTKHECVNDSDCKGEGGHSFCAWDATSSAWECVYPQAC